MSSFLKAALCSGQRPDGLLPVRHVPRPDLIARLLRSRSVARFLVAPDGFGKTASGSTRARPASCATWTPGSSPRAWRS